MNPKDENGTVDGNKILRILPEAMYDIKGHADCYALLMQLMSDFNLTLDDLSSELESYKDEESDSDEYALYKCWDDYGFSEDGESVIKFFNHILIAGSGVSEERKYDDATLLWQFSENRLLKKRGYKFTCSDHEWNDEFKIAVMKDSHIISETPFKYASELHHHAIDLVKEIAEAVVKDKISFIPADNGTDSVSFIVMDTVEYEYVKNIYGNDLSYLLNPYIKK